MKKMLFGLIAILIGISLVLVFMEIFLRMNPRFGYIYTSFKTLELSDARMLEHFEEDCLRPCALMGYENIPNRCGVNFYGLRGKEYEFLKTNNTFRILLLGDSIAWINLIKKFLEQDLNSSSNSKYKFEIWNAGVPSYDVRRYYLYLKHKGLNYKPDMVLIFLFMNDFNLDTNIYYKDKDGVTAYDFPLTEISKRFIVNPLLMKRSYLYRFVILKLNSYLLSRKNKTINHAEEEGRYYLRMISEICQKNEIPLFIAVFPYLKPLKELKDWQRVQFCNISKVVAELKLDYLNLYNLYNKLFKENFSIKNRRDDDIHPSEAPSRLIAREICNYILDKGNNIFLAN